MYAEPKRDTVTWYQISERSQMRGGPGEWSKAGSPAGDPIANIEWKAKSPVNEKADLFQWKRAALLRVEQVGRI